jgi:hypothetical protein
MTLPLLLVIGLAYETLWWRSLISRGDSRKEERLSMLNVVHAYAISFVICLCLVVFQWSLSRYSERLRMREFSYLYQSIFCMLVLPNLLGFWMVLGKRKNKSAAD